MGQERRGQVNTSALLDSSRKTSAAETPRKRITQPHGQRTASSGAGFGEVMEDTPNFFRARRNELAVKHRQKISQFDMAVRFKGLTPSSIGSWERDEVVPAVPISKLAQGYEVSESVMEREVMALRRRIEAREAAAVK